MLEPSKCYQRKRIPLVSRTNAQAFWAAKTVIPQPISVDFLILVKVIDPKTQKFLHFSS